MSENPNVQAPDPASSGEAGIPTNGTAPEGQGQGGNEAFWTMFPNVPEDVRPTLEPHIRDVQAYVTRIEQESAPFRQLPSDEAQQLLRFNSDLNSDPVSAWIQLGQALQRHQLPDGRYAVDPEVDLDYLAQLANGEDPEAGTPAFGEEPGAGVQGQDDVSPQVLGYIQRLEAEVEELKSGFQEDRTSRQTQIQDQLYQRRLGQLKSGLIKSGWPEELITDQYLTSAVVTARGDFQQAAKMLLDQRQGLLKGLAERRTSPQDLDMPNGVPNSPSREERPRDKDDPFAKTRRTAEARLRRGNQPG